MDERDIYVGGENLSRPIYLVVVTLPDGAPGLFGPLAGRGRAKLVEPVTTAVLRAERTDLTPVEAHRVWVQLRSVPDGHWSGLGEIVTLADLASYGLNRGEPGSKVDRMRDAALKSVANARQPLS